MIEKYGVENRREQAKQELEEVRSKLLEKTASDGETKRLEDREKELVEFLGDDKLA